MDINNKMPSLIGNYYYLGDISGSTLSTNSRTNFALNTSINNYRLIRLNVSYYTAGLPDYGGVTISTEMLKRATNESIYVIDLHATNGIGICFSVRYINETTLSVALGRGSSHLYVYQFINFLIKILI